MTINIQVFEEHGPVVNGRGTVTEVAHFCMTGNSDISVPYYLNPLRRPSVVSEVPETNEDQTLTFNKYLFYKISGDYGTIKNVKISLASTNNEANHTQLFCGFTNTYQEPINTMDGRLIYRQGPIVWYPNLGDSPQNATTRPVTITNQTVYTQYLVTQLRVNGSTWNDVGNTPTITLTFSLNELA